MSKHSQAIPSTAALRAFDAAATHLSFTDAAAQLNLTQGAVSHRIKELEQRLGVMLFHRRARGIGLTRAGERYLPHVREALRQLRAGAAAVATPIRNRVLTVSMSPNFAVKWLVPRLGSFVSAHPEIDLRISASVEHVHFDGDGIDMAIRHGNGHWPGLNVTALCREITFPVCSAQFAQSHQPLATLADLARVTLLHDQHHEHWRAWLSHFGVSFDPKAMEHGPVFSQSSLAIDAAVAGQGIALSRSALVALDLAQGRLVRPVAEFLPAPFAYWIVYPNVAAASLAVDTFSQWLLNEATASTVEHIATPLAPA